MNVQIRRATIDDAETIARQCAAMAAETENLDLDRQILLQGVQAVLEDRSKGFYTLAEVEGVVVGQMMVTFEWSDWRNGTFWWLQSVYVRPECRHRGVCKQLYHSLLDVVRGRNDICGLRLYVSKENPSAQLVYERLGLHKTHYDMYEVDFVLRR